MAKFTDAHNGYFGATAAELREAHQRALECEESERMHVERTRPDPETGQAFGLSRGPSQEAGRREPGQAGPATTQTPELPAEVD